MLYKGFLLSIEKASVNLLGMAEQQSRGLIPYSSCEEKQEKKKEKTPHTFKIILSERSYVEMTDYYMKHEEHVHPTS